MRNAIVREYRRLRAKGWTGGEALRTAKIKVAFDDADDLVKIDAEPECEAYDDSYIDTWTDVSASKRAQAKKETRERIASEGTWCLVGYWRLSNDDDWTRADSIGGFIGDDWQDSGYDADMMSTALDALAEAQLRDRAEHFEVAEPVAEGWQ